MVLDQVGGGLRSASARPTAASSTAKCGKPSRCSPVPTAPWPAKPPRRWPWVAATGEASPSPAPETSTSVPFLTPRRCRRGWCRRPNAARPLPRIGCHPNRLKEEGDFTVQTNCLRTGDRCMSSSMHHPVPGGRWSSAADSGSTRGNLTVGARRAARRTSRSTRNSRCHNRRKIDRASHRQRFRGRAVSQRD